MDTYVYNTPSSTEFGGLLGATGRVGWFFPSYLLDNSSDNLIDYRSFRQLAVARMFSRNVSHQDVGTYRGPAKNWVQFDEMLINNLRLKLVVEYAQNLPNFDSTGMVRRS